MQQRVASVPDQPQALAETPAALAPGGLPLSPEHLLALQRTAGNRAVAALVARKPLSNDAIKRDKAPGPLSKRAQNQALAVNESKFDGNSIRIIQTFVGRPPTGTLVPEDAQAIAGYRWSHRIGFSGYVDEDVLDHFMLGNARHDDVIHLIVDFFDLDTSAALAVRFSDQVTPGQGARWRRDGELRIIEIGPHAFTTAKTVRDEIARGIAHAVPKFSPYQRGPMGAPTTPRLLSAAQEADAVDYNRRTLRDRRAILGVQAAINGMSTGVMDGATAQFLAQFLVSKRLGPHGRLNSEVFNVLYEEISGAGNFNTLLRLIVDFHRLDNDAVLAVDFDTDVEELCELRGAGPGAPVTLRFGGATFAIGPQFAVHTIANFYEQARLRRAGGLGANPDAGAFLGAAVELLSTGMEQEELASFSFKAHNALKAYKQTTPAEKQALWPKFLELRRKVHERFAMATGAERGTRLTLHAYDAEQPPPPAKQAR